MFSFYFAFMYLILIILLWSSSNGRILCLWNISQLSLSEKQFKKVILSFPLDTCDAAPSSSCSSTSSSSIIALHNEEIPQHSGADAAKQNTLAPWLWSMPTSPPRPLLDLVDGIKITTCIMRGQLLQPAPQQPHSCVLPHFQAEAGKQLQWSTAVDGVVTSS